MTVISNTRGNPQFSDLAAQEALPLVGTASREDGQTVLDTIDADLARLYEDRNILLTKGGQITFTGTTVTFTEALTLEINSQVAGGAPTIIDLGATTRTLSADGRMIYATIDRTLGTAVVTDDATTLPAVVAANKEVFLLIKRRDDTSGLKRAYFRTGMALDEGQTAALGSSGSGSGSGNEILETLKNQLNDSPYALLTPNIFRTDTDDKVDGSSTGTYDLVTKTFQFSGAGQTLVSTQMLDPTEFLDDGKSLSKIDLSVFWAAGSVDTAATYEVSRNGGNAWQAVTMERVGDATEVYRGEYAFTTETNQTITDNTATINSTTGTLNSSTQRRLGQSFVLSSTTLLRRVTFNVTKTGTPAGFIFVQVVNNSGGTPGTTVFSESAPISANSLVTGSNTLDLGTVVLVPGTYHVVVRTDDAYKAASGANNLTLNGNLTADGRSNYNGTVWSDAGTTSIQLLTLGIALDLRVRITSSAGSKALDGYGIFYDLEPVGVASGVKQLEVRKFKAVADNLSSFTLTNFLPDPDVMTVYYVEGGQAFKYGAFTLQGYTVQFPTNSFNNGGVEADVTLVFAQLEGSGFDNSDSNAALLTANHLGSTDATIDKSLAGFGLFLRRPDGTLREIAIDNNDNLVIYSV